MGSFEELKVCQRAKELAVFLYKLTGRGAFVKYLAKQDFDHVKEECQAISRMLTRLIRARLVNIEA